MTQLQEYLDTKKEQPFKRELPLKLNIQFFADGDGADGTSGGNDDNDTDNNDQGLNDNQNDDNNKSETIEFTPEQQTKVNQIVQDRVKAEQKKAAEAVAESKKLEKMNAEQKQVYELEKANNRIAELEAKENLYQMSKEASKMLSDKGISVTDELLEQVTKDTAEDTQTAVSTFLTIVDSEVQRQVAEKLRGGAPKGSTSTTQTEEEPWKAFL